MAVATLAGANMTIHSFHHDDLVPQLLAATNDLTVAMARAEAAHLGHAAISTTVKDIQEAYERQVHEDTQFKNADQRKAEVRRRMLADWSEHLASLDTAEQEKYTTAQDVARLEQDTKTLRAVLAYEASRMQLEAAHLAAESMPRLIRR